MNIYLDKIIEKVGMGSEDMCNKHPTLTIKFEDGDIITFGINEESFYKIKKLVSHIDIKHGRWFSDGNDKCFEFIRREDWCYIHDEEKDCYNEDGDHDDYHCRKCEGIIIKKR